MPDKAWYKSKTIIGAIGIPIIVFAWEQGYLTETNLYRILALLATFEFYALRDAIGKITGVEK